MTRTPTPAAAAPRRRSLLVGALGAASAVASLAGCSGQDASPAGAERSDAARALRARSAHESERLLARYQGTLTVHPALGDRLRPLRDEIARHVRALADTDGGAARENGGSPSPSGSGAPSGSPTPAPSGSTGAPPEPDTESVPHDEKDALSALAKAERRLADSRTKALSSAPPELARLLASVAACGSAHVYLLEHPGAPR